MASILQITVRIGEPLRRAVGKYRILVSLQAPANLADLIAQLASAYPDFENGFQGGDLGHAYPYRLFVNHVLIPDEIYGQHELQDGDLVHIIIPTAGGASSRRSPSEYATAIKR